MSNGSRSRSLFRTAFKLLKLTTQEWLSDRAPQLGAALAYYTVFSLAPLSLVLLAIIGVIFREDPAGAYGAVSSLITPLLWVYYSSQILLFGAEFTQVYASECGSPIKPDKFAVQIERQGIEKSD
jgi:uncharacterized BrkB/YihY/UPF0761 family membrane protein